MNCDEYNRLQEDVQAVLDELVHLTSTHLESFRSGNYEICRRIDSELELTMGKKERSIGALRQHMKEHQCRGTETI